MSRCSLLVLLFSFLSGSILQSCKTDSPSVNTSLSKSQLFDKIKGGWAGQAIGVSFGSHTEFKYQGTFIQDYQEKGIRKIICTDIGRDGMLQGPAVDLYKEIQEQVPDIYLIASGGISSIADIERLTEAGIPAVIFGKAIYEGRISLKELEQFSN